MYIYKLFLRYVPTYTVIGRARLMLFEMRLERKDSEKNILEIISYDFDGTEII